MYCGLVHECNTRAHTHTRACVCVCVCPAASRRRATIIYTHTNAYIDASTAASPLLPFGVVSCFCGKTRGGCNSLTRPPRDLQFVLFDAECKC